MSEVPVGAGRHVADEGGAPLRLVVPVQLPGLDGGLGAGVASRQGLVGQAVVLPRVTNVRSVDVVVAVVLPWTEKNEYLWLCQSVLKESFVVK